MRAWALMLLLLSLCMAESAARGDVVYLSDGTTLEGDVKRGAEGWVVTGADGQKTVVAADKVRSIEVRSGPGKGSTTQPEEAEARLYSLRRSVENLSDLAEIVQRFERFLERYKDTETGRAAASDLAMWRDRQQRGLVKVGQQWVTPREQAEMLEQTVAVVSEARQLIKDGRLDDADALLVKAMQVDPSNPSVQYLRGLVKYRQDEVPAARKAFELVTEQLPNHAPSLNNLAVILTRQNRPAASMGMYDRAMQADEANRHILDNVAEAFNAMSRSERKASVVQRAIQRFLEQDEKLQDVMRQRGLYRWGSTWVNEQQLEELKAAEAKIKGRLDQLAAEFDAAQARIDLIRQDVEANNRTLRMLESRSYGTGVGGQPVRSELPPRYYQLQQDNARLEEEHQQQVRKMQQLRAAARDVEKQFPTPRYTGTQKLIETEGTPIELPAVPAATQPTSAPGSGT